MVKLSAGKHPVAETEKEQRSLSQIREDGIVELLIVGWRDLVHIVDHVVLKTVEDQKGYRRNWEKDWNTCSEHHGDENDIHDTRVSEVEEIHWTCISVNVLLN